MIVSTYQWRSSSSPLRFDILKIDCLSSGSDGTSVLKADAICYVSVSLIGHFDNHYALNTFKYIHLNTQIQVRLNT